MKQVLIIEDDNDLAELLTIHLEDLGCKVIKVMTGEDGFQLALKNPYDLIILDVMLPGMDGLEVCRKLRASEATWPILILSSKSEEIDRILGLETGADDYLAKPFSVLELIARVKSMFRRTNINSSLYPSSPEVFQIGELKIDCRKRKVTINEQRVDLTRKEFDILQLLALNSGKSYSREDLINEIWGYEFAGYESTVSTHINRLRAKIEPDFTKPTYILTTWGVGYRFNDGLQISK